MLPASRELGALWVPGAETGSVGHGSNGSTDVDGSRGSWATHWPMIKSTKFQEQLLTHKTW